MSSELPLPRSWAVVSMDSDRVLAGPFGDEGEAFTWKATLGSDAQYAYVAKIVHRYDIPRIIHRIWLDESMPERFEEYGRMWQSMHEGRGWKVMDWRDSSQLPPLINQDIFDQARYLCPRDWKRFQADLLRLELLYLYGGIYVDTDCEPLKPFDPLTFDRQVLIAHSPNKFQGTRILTQAVIGSSPGHPFIRDCIRALPDSVERFRDRPLAQMIGPHMITRVWKDGGWKHSGMVKPVPSYWFYPQSNEARDKGREPDLRKSYCWHRWNNTLRKKGQGLG